MKKLILLFTLLFAFTVNAQQSPDFPGRRPELLLGKEVKVKTISPRQKEEGLEGFYTNEEMFYIYKENDKSKTNADVFNGRTFTVLAIDVVDRYGIKKSHRIKIQDVANGEILYFEYNKDNSWKFVFDVVGGLQLPPDFYCDYVTETTDKFTGEQTFVTESQFLYKLTKYIKGTVQKYTLYLTASKDEFVEGKGVIILLEGNKRIEKPNVAVKMEPMKTVTPSYSVTFELTPDDIALLKQYPIIDFRLFKYDGSISSFEGKKLMGGLNCMLSK